MTSLRGPHSRPRVFALVALAALALAGCAAGQSSTGAGAAATTSPTSTVSDAPVIVPGQYWYTRTLWTVKVPNPIVPNRYAAGTTPKTVTVAFIERQVFETWIGTDGTERIRVNVLSDRPATPAAARRWRASGQPLPTASSTDSVQTGGGSFPPLDAGSAGDLGDGLYTFPELLSLPTSGPAMAASIAGALAAYNHRTAHGLKLQVDTPPGSSSSRFHIYGKAPNGAWTQLNTIAQLEQLPIPAAARLALMQAATLITGAGVNDGAHDPLGRPGTSVTVGPPANILRLVFDPSSGELLSQASIPAGGASHGFGSIVQTVLAQGAVSSIDALPVGIAPVGHGTAAAPTIAIAPAVGDAHAAFTLTTSTAPPQPHLLGPTARDCRAYLFPPPTMTLRAQKGGPAGASGGSGGTVGRRYQFTPASIGRSAWCPGIYELQTAVNGQQAAAFFKVG